MKSEGLAKLKASSFNVMCQESQPDGSVLITLSKRGEGKVYRFRVMNLYKANEEILEDEVSDS